MSKIAAVFLLAAFVAVKLQTPTEPPPIFCNDDGDCVRHCDETHQGHCYTQGNHTCECVRDQGEVIYCNDNEDCRHHCARHIGRCREALHTCRCLAMGDHWWETIGK